jgi:4-amino-4-deoxy-L-arabinose transferase-like glycosyltransferase
VERKRGAAWWALGLFIVSAPFVAWTSASRFGDNIDEGIYLDGGLRMAHGEMLYRDFFTYLAPATFASLAALFRVFGESLAAARVPVTLDLALMTALVFLLIDRLATRLAAISVSACYLVFQTFNPNFVVANHRWDSAALSLAAVTCAFFLQERPSHRWAAGAGICAALAAWTTFSFALLGLVLAAWLLCDRSLRRYFKTYAVAFSSVCVAFFAWLAWNRALLPMIQGVLWSMRNYSVPNRTVYGYVIGAYDDLFQHAGPIESALLSIMLLVVTLPATMPLICAVGWPLRLRSHPERRIVFLLICAAAILLSTWPRPDMTHLMYISALPYVLTTVLLVRTLGRRGQAAIAALLLVSATCEAGLSVYYRITEPTLATRVGVLHGKPEYLAVLRTIQTQVPSDRTLFVFPYWPVFYFTTGARNPTRFSYLQPGMFPKQDEDEVLQTLSAHPPDTVIYRRVAPASYLRIWPSSDPARLRMSEIEDFLRSHYKTVAREGKFQVLRPVPVTQIVTQ